MLDWYRVSSPSPLMINDAFVVGSTSGRGGVGTGASAYFRYAKYVPKGSTVSTWT